MQSIEVGANTEDKLRAGEDSNILTLCNALGEVDANTEDKSRAGDDSNIFTLHCAML